MTQCPACSGHGKYREAPPVNGQPSGWHLMIDADPRRAWPSSSPEWVATHMARYLVKTCQPCSGTGQIND